MSYSVVRTDKMFGTDNRGGVESVKYMGSGTTATAIENGNVVKLDGLLAVAGSNPTDYERQIFKGVTPAADSNIDEVVLICSPEVMYDERKKDLAEFRNEAGDVCRAYRFHTGDIFSVTADGLTGTCAIGSVIELQAGIKLKAVNSATSGSTKVGKCVDVETVGPYTFYVIQVG